MEGGWCNWWPWLYGHEENKRLSRGEGKRVIMGGPPLVTGTGKGLVKGGGPLVTGGSRIEVQQGRRPWVVIAEIGKGLSEGAGVF